MDSRTLDQVDFETLHALLSWQVDAGATEAIGDETVDRYGLAEDAPPFAALAPAGVAKSAATRAETDRRSEMGVPLQTAGDPAAAAVTALHGVADIAGLRAAMGEFMGCDLRKGARNTVFADGQPGARVMVIGEPPDRDEDAMGRPMVGPAGRLFDRMFAAIGMARDAPPESALYVTSILPWRPPHSDPDDRDIAMMLPFVQRHVELAKPDIVVIMGNVACIALLGRKGVTRLRGAWTTALERPALAMFHPGYLLRMPGAKREAWHDLLMLQARLRG